MTPNIYFFNPTCELAIVNGTVSFMPNKFLSLFENDLDILPLYFSKPEDIVLVNSLPDKKFIDELNNLGIKTPSFMVYSEALKDNEFLKSEKNELRPWGWSPRMHHMFKKFKHTCRPEYLSLESSDWHPDNKAMYSRITALAVLKDFIYKNKADNILKKECIAVVCKSIADVKKYHAKWGKVILKAPWSSAGRGIQILRKDELNSSIENWISAFLKQQEYIMLEPLLDKKADFSLHYISDGKGSLVYKGVAYFYANENGQYKKNYLGKLPPEIAVFFKGIDLDKVSAQLMSSLKTSSIQNKYKGSFGVDCILFEEDNKIKIQPCLEINLRYSMGTIAISVNKMLDERKPALFNIFADRDVKFSEFSKKMQIEHPQEIKNGKWYKGFFPLISPYQEKTFGVYVLIP